ncbi:lysoplasmalogenase [Amycolatopsis sp. NBC_01307]|uniref:lysoplasmalogenase family protein n=1 Tax=Amycolatopsis sp. NBC_01307 TaxID=2903561 RepID=UPI002E138271|nr:lysoplasmalogenase [Amycolatopsis sp. NBC_01307]
MSAPGVRGPAARRLRGVARRAFPWCLSADAVAALTGSAAPRWWTKPVLVPVLAAAAPPPDPGLAVGLAGSWIGDLALLGTTDRHFRAGIAAFAAAHAGYAASFAARGGRPPLRRAAPIAAAGVGGAWFFGRAAGDLAGPVRAYALAIAAMAITAAGLRGPGSRRVVTGAGVFMLSDALIGLRRFVLPPTWSRPADLMVMLTYGVAQWLIHTPGSGEGRRGADAERGRSDVGERRG